MTAMTLEELVNAAREYVGDDKAKAKEVATALHAEVQPIAQALIDKGFAGEKRKYDAKVTEAEDAKAAAETLAAEKDTEIAELRSKTPDAQKIEQQATEKWSKKVETARAEALKARQERDAERVSMAKARFAAELKTLGIDDDYADEVLTSRFSDRLITTEDGTLQVLQVGETTPIVPQDGKADSAIKLLAAEVKKTVKPEWIRNNGESGAGVGGRGRAPSAPGAPDVKSEKLRAPEYRPRF